MITGNAMLSTGPEMLFFINGIMEANYRKNISPWPQIIKRTEKIRPIMHRDKITIQEPFRGDYITLVNANQNKGVHVFLDLAKRMPDRKFLGVLPYYGELKVPMATPNVDWVPFDDDIRNILKKTRILLFSSYYESFGRIAVEAMVNGIPVLYSKPAKKSVYPGGSTEGLEEWISPAGIGCDRESPDEWMSAIQSLDDEATYVSRGEQSKQHIQDMNLFTEANRIASMVESFAREHPAPIRSSAPQSQPQSKGRDGMPPPLREPPPGAAGFGFSNGRLKIRR
jgi:glycosyltransferase involved in cell wall biosynthesis